MILRCKLSDTDFDNKIDSNENLLGMMNGTYDLGTGTLRLPRASDYISLESGVRYEDVFSEPDTISDIS